MVSLKIIKCCLSFIYITDIEYILIIGSLYLAFSFILSVNGNTYFYNLFQKLWYPVFIPSLSLFFTAILVEAVINSLVDRKNK